MLRNTGFVEVILQFSKTSLKKILKQTCYYKNKYKLICNDRVKSRTCVGDAERVAWQYASEEKEQGNVQ